MGAVKDVASIWDNIHYDTRNKEECKRKCQEMHHCDAFVFNEKINPPQCETITFGHRDKIEYAFRKTFGFKNCEGILFI